MYISFLGCIYKDINPNSCNKLYKEITIYELNDIGILISYIKDLWNIRGDNCPKDCIAISFCTQGKPNLLSDEFICNFAKNITYFDDNVKKEVEKLQSNFKYNTVKQSNKINKKSIDENQLTLF